MLHLKIVDFLEQELQNLPLGDHEKEAYKQEIRCQVEKAIKCSAIPDKLQQKLIAKYELAENELNSSTQVDKEEEDISSLKVHLEDPTDWGQIKMKPSLRESIR